VSINEPNLARVLAVLLAEIHYSRHYGMVTTFAMPVSVLLAYTGCD